MANAMATGSDLLAQVETDIGGDLVVARTPGMQLFARIADQLGKASLDVHVHIFERHRPFKAILGDLVANLLQAVLDSG